MAWSNTTLSIKDGGGTTRTMLACTDATNHAFTHILASAPHIVAAGGTITRVADANIYAAGDFIANNVTAASCTLANSGFTIAAARGTDIPGELLTCILRGTGTAVSQRLFGVHIFNTDPLASAPANGDNGAFTPAGTGSNYLGSFYVTMRRAFGSGSVGIGVPLDGSSIPFNPVTGTANLYALLTAEAAYTQVNGETFSLTTVTR